MLLNFRENGERLLIHRSSCFTRGFYFFFFLRQIYAHIGVFVFTHTFSISISLYALSFSLPSLFLVTVYPVEGSGNTNRLSLPCGFSSSSYPFCLLLFLYSSVPYFPSSICAPLLNVVLPFVFLTFLHSVLLLNTSVLLPSSSYPLVFAAGVLLPTSLFLPLPLKPQEPGLNH